jgi:hypothetical protein
MALVATPIYKWAWSASEFFAIISVTDAGTYVVGGYTITPAMFTFTTFASTSDFQLQAPPTFGAVGIWTDGQVGNYGIFDQSTGKLKIAVSSTGLELGAVSAAGIVTAICAFGH